METAAIGLVCFIAGYVMAVILEKKGITPSVIEAHLAQEGARAGTNIKAEANKLIDAVKQAAAAKGIKL